VALSTSAVVSYSCAADGLAALEAGAKDRSFRSRWLGNDTAAAEVRAVKRLNR
jgi:hypothetical protein